ncbi:MAG: hypothetical protein M1825_005152 [Sarcosagium campestre]|nr:MAG: hypothetical protein M1825_005152 [Sarcosagium campestre]
MANEIVPWLYLIPEQFETVTKYRSQQEAGQEVQWDGDYKTVGDQVTVTLNSSSHMNRRTVQILEFLSYESPVRAIISDSRISVHCVFSKTGESTFSKSHFDQRITKDTLHGLIQLQKFEVKISPRASNGGAICLIVHECVLVNVGGAKMYGRPMPIDTNPRVVYMLEDLVRRADEGIRIPAPTPSIEVEGSGKAPLQTDTAVQSSLAFSSAAEGSDGHALTALGFPCRSLSKRVVSLPQDQADVLARDDSWIPPFPGRRAPCMNIPIGLLKSLSKYVDEAAETKRRRGIAEAKADAEKAKAGEEANGPSPQSPAEDTIAAASDSEPFSGWLETQKKSWIPPSSPSPTLKKDFIPPNSSAEAGDPSSLSVPESCRGLPDQGAPHFQAEKGEQGRESSPMSHSSRLSPGLPAKRNLFNQGADIAVHAVKVSTPALSSDDAPSELEMCVPMALGEAPDIESEESFTVPRRSPSDLDGHTPAAERRNIVHVERTPMMPQGQDRLTVNVGNERTQAPSAADFDAGNDGSKTSSCSRVAASYEAAETSRVGTQRSRDDNDAVDSHQVQHLSPSQSSGLQRDRQALTQKHWQTSARADPVITQDQPLMPREKIKRLPQPVTVKRKSGPLDASKRMHKRLKMPSSFHFSQETRHVQDPSLLARQQKREYLSTILQPLPQPRRGRSREQSASNVKGRSSRCGTQPGSTHHSKVVHPEPVRRISATSRGSHPHKSRISVLAAAIFPTDEDDTDNDADADDNDLDADDDDNDNGNHSDGDIDADADDEATQPRSNPTRRRLGHTRIQSRKPISPPPLSRHASSRALQTPKGSRRGSSAVQASSKLSRRGLSRSQVSGRSRPPSLTSQMSPLSQPMSPSSNGRSVTHPRQRSPAISAHSAKAAPATAVSATSAPGVGISDVGASGVCAFAIAAPAIPAPTAAAASRDGSPDVTAPDVTATPVATPAATASTIPPARAPAPRPTTDPTSHVAPSSAQPQPQPSTPTATHPKSTAKTRRRTSASDRPWWHERCTPFKAFSRNYAALLSVQGSLGPENITSGSPGEGGLQGIRARGTTNKVDVLGWRF